MNVLISFVKKKKPQSPINKTKREKVTKKNERGRNPNPNPNPMNSSYHVNNTFHVFFILFNHAYSPSEFMHNFFIIQLKVRNITLSQKNKCHFLFPYISPTVDCITQDPRSLESIPQILMTNCQIYNLKNKK